MSNNIDILTILKAILVALFAGRKLNLPWESLNDNDCNEQNMKLFIGLLFLVVGLISILFLIGSWTVTALLFLFIAFLLLTTKGNKEEK